MDKILSMNPAVEGAAELHAAIAQCLGEIDDIRRQMSRQDVSIEQSSQETRAVLAEIADVLAELKAA